MLPSLQLEAQDHTTAVLMHLQALLARPAFPWVLDALRACTELVQRNTSETGLAIWLEFSWEEYCSFFLQVGSVGSGETKDGVVTVVDGTTDDRDFGRLKEAFYYVFTSYINAINTNNPGRPNSSPSNIVFLLFKTIPVTLEEESGGESEVGSANASTASMPVRFNECLMQELKKSEVDVVLQDFDDNGSHPGINAISTHIAPAHPHPIFPNLNIHECTTDTLRNELNNFLLAAWYHAWPPSQYISSLPPPWDDISSHTTDYVNTSLLPRCTRLCDPETMDDKTVLMFCMHFVLMREMKTSLNLGQNGSDMPVYAGFRFKTKYQIFVAQLARGFYSTTNSGVKPESDGNILNADSIDNTFQHYLRANAVRVHDEDNANADAMTVDEEEFEVDETLMDISSSQSTAVISSLADADGDVQEIAAWTGTANRSESIISRNGSTLGDLRRSTRHKSSSSDQPEYHRSLASARDEDSSNKSRSTTVRNTNTAGSAEMRTRTRTPGTPVRSSPRRRSANNYSANDVSRAANGDGDGSAIAAATVSRSSAISQPGSAESESESRETRKTKEEEFETKSSSATSSNSSKTISQPRTQSRTRAQTRSRTQTRLRGTTTGTGKTQDSQKSLSSISARLRGKKTLLGLYLTGTGSSALPGSSRSRSTRTPRNNNNNNPAKKIGAGRKNLRAMGGRASRSMSGSIASRLRKR